jgi:two-component system sensor histidine kinase/response regulator
MTNMLVHDMRSPLMALTLCLEAIQQNRSVGVPDSMSEDVRSCIEITSVVTEMIGTLLDIGKFEAGAMPMEIGECDTFDIIQEGVSRVRVGTSIPIHVSTLSLSVRWDSNLIIRAVSNLVSNALKYGDSKPIQVNCLEIDNFVEIQVDDAGPGIPFKERAHLFEKFRSLQSGDGRRNTSGLGLYFCKQVITAHGGTLGVISLEPRGSRFWLRLPKAVSPLPTSSRPDPGLIPFKDSTRTAK